MGAVGPCKGHIRLYWNMDLGGFMLVVLLLFWGQRMVKFQLLACTVSGLHREYIGSFLKDYQAPYNEL